MNRQLQPALTAFAVGLIGLGVLALIHGDFALVWQPVPVSLPGRSVLAYASGLLMFFGGIGLLFRASAAWSARLLFPYLFVWLLLKVPALVVAPKMEAVWLGFGEIAVLFAAGWVVFATLAEPSSAPILTLVSGQWGIRLATMLFGIALIPIGLSHIVYTSQTVALIPTWLPFRTALAYLTGAGQIICGVAVLLSIFPRIAAAVEAAMVSLFAILVWLPAILASPKARLPWTAFFITWFFASSAWVVSRGISSDLRTPDVATKK
ncbi:DoxX family protein [Terriglobus sp. RCC_193]|uniref:DoxX family protein n=1 Tax=Terriglobus sp. RCC_193 TaxID=3239218 RepID=UPI0035243E0A